MSLLDEGIENAKADDRRVVELQLFGEPADAIFDRDAEADDDIRAREDLLQEDDHDLLDHHDQSGPGDEPANRVGNALGHPDETPEEPLAEQAGEHNDDKTEQEDEKQLGGAAIINKAHQRFLVRPVEPELRIGNGGEQIHHRI